MIVVCLARATGRTCSEPVVPNGSSSPARRMLQPQDDVLSTRVDLVADLELGEARNVGPATTATKVPSDFLA